MPPQQPGTNSHSATPHSISLKVLRLSRATLATQIPLPETDFGGGLDIDRRASLAYPSSLDRSSFSLSHLLTLPSSFGQAYVGERFACTLCANNELEVDSGKSVSALRISAELQTPSEPSGVSLELETSADEGGDDDSYDDLAPGRTLQLKLQHNLKEAGPHVLAVTVTYVETTPAEESEGKVRTFRKLYQFTAQHLMSIRSKVTERKQGQEKQLRQWIIEAQLENVGENSVLLDKVGLKGQDGLAVTLVGAQEMTTLKSQDIQQVMFLVNELTRPAVSGRRQLGQVIAQWRSPMGEVGRLTTGWLTSKS